MTIDNQSSAYVTRRRRRNPGNPRVMTSHPPGRRPRQSGSRPVSLLTELLSTIRERERERERVAVLSFISADTRRRVLFPFTISRTSTKFRVVNFRQLAPLCATKLKQVSTVLIARGRIAAAPLSFAQLSILVY